jgi:hypothetical protein
MKIIQGFTWWLVPSVQVMCVDNVNATELDFTGLPANLYMAIWREGRGEVETTDAPGLRTNFTDVTPYTSYFQKFMTAKNTDGALTLAQAKKIQSDLVTCLFDDKRQVPYAFTPAGGTSQNWSANDTDVAAMSLEAIPFIAGGGSSTSLGSLVTQINAMIDAINAGIVSPGTTNAGVVNQINNVLNGNIFPNLRPLIVTGSTSPNTFATPGLPAGTNTNAGSAGAMSSIGHIAGAGTGTGSANIPWSPIGATTPINLTMIDFTAIMTGISTRRQSLLNTRNTKINQINALSTIATVISYNVTAGW